MGSKDILEKHLESYNDVFADMINVFIFDGKAVIAENELEDIDPKSFYVEDKQVREQWSGVNTSPLSSISSACMMVWLFTASSVPTAW